MNSGQDRESEPTELQQYRDHVQRQIRALNYGLTRVLFGEYDVVLRPADADVEFGNLAMMANVAINSARLAGEETAQLLAEQSVDRSRLDAILEATDSGLICFSREGRAVYLNSSFELLTGTRAKDILGCTIAEVCSMLSKLGPDPADAFSSLSERVGSVHYSRCSITSPEERTLRVGILPILSGPDAQGSIVVLRDLTEVIASRRAREELLGNLAHEFRTPLTAIKGFIDLLASEQLGSIEPAQLTGLNVVKRNVGRLVELVQNLLAVDRMKSGAIDRSATVLGEVVNEVIESEQVTAEMKRISLEVSLDPSLVVQCGRPMLKQILRNLVSNAVKYTQRGSVQVRTARVDGVALFECRDTGIGICAEDQESVFDRFFRSSDEAIESIGGTGVGLAIVRRFVESVEGRVELESERGRGSTFRVYLPLAQGA